MKSRKKYSDIVILSLIYVFLQIVCGIIMMKIYNEVGIKRGGK